MMDFEDIRFTPFAFLRDKLLIILAALAIIAFDTLVLWIMRVSTDAIILMDGLQLTVLIIILLIEYQRRARFYRKLELMIDNLDKANHIIDLVDEPTFVEGAIACQTNYEVARLASSELTELKARSSESADYTELWVHEVKTPLAAMLLVVDKMHGDDAKKLKYELERIERLVNQALFAARSSSLTNDYSIRPLKLREAVSDACKDNMQYLTSLGITLDLQIDAELSVLADKSWLVFILSQLITNAAKYDASTITFTAQPPVEEGPDAQTIFEIRDNGCGIPAADVPRVFDRGFTGEVGRAHGSATGMGLYLAARLCAAMGLSILLASEEGVGTRVQIGFPHDRRRMELQGAELPYAE